MTQANGQRYLTTAEVAELLRTSAETVRFWRHVGKGPKNFKIGRRVLYAVEDVDSFIDEARRAEELKRRMFSSLDEAHRKMRERDLRDRVREAEGAAE